MSAGHEVTRLLNQWAKGDPGRQRIKPWRTGHTVYRIGSITKMFTAMMLEHLIPMNRRPIVC